MRVRDGSGPVWRKSGRSGTDHCVEIAWRQGAEGINILVRDSKFPGREPLVFTPGEWAEFLQRAKTGNFDVLAGPPAPQERRPRECAGVPAGQPSARRSAGAP